jgi:hypothetical protein
MLTVYEIQFQRRQLTTDLQWQHYRRNIRGEQIRFSGEVIEVYSNGEVQIDDGEGIVVVTLYGVPTDLALSLYQNQYVEGIGTVRDVYTLFTFVVDIDVLELHP